jgi:hypothetical protein
MSVFGDIRVEHISPQGKTTLVGTVKGIAVYTPNPLRRFIMDLDKKARVNYHGGTLHVTFSAQADTRPEKYAEAELILH